MNTIPSECAARSLGPANQLVGLLIQTLLSSYCELSNPGWPRDCANAIDGEYFDYIVVGAGSSGSVVAGRLSEDPSSKILLLEAGGDPPIESDIPAELLALQRSRVDWQYYASAKRGCLASTTGNCYWPRGKMLGGSSAMNYMIFVRGNKKNYDFWASLGNTKWDYEHVLKYFRRWEGNRDPIIAENKHYHNTCGPVDISFFERYHYAQTIIKAAKEKGNKIVLDINAEEALGYFHAQSYIYNGVRQSAARAYLIPAANRPNLCVRKHAHAFKILFDENKRAIGVQYNLKGMQNFTAYARKEVVLSAGTIGSAQLLLLSGIGPKNHLDKFNIETISNLPVGKALFDHVSVLVFFKFKGKPALPKATLDSEYSYLMYQNGPLASLGAIEVQGFMNTNKSSRYPDTQYSHSYYTQNASNLVQFLQQNNFGEDIQETLIDVNKEHHILLVFVILMQPKSVGSIKLKTASYKDYPSINANYFDHPDDMETMVRAVKNQVSFQDTKAFKKRKGEFIRLPVCQQYEYGSKSYWQCYNQFMSMTLYHPCGTSKMGPKSDRSTVVSPKLKVHGVTGLRQADFGIAPYIISGNTNAASLMIGERAAEFIRREDSQT